MDIGKSTSIRNYALTALCLAAIVGVLSFAALNYTQIQQENYHRERGSILQVNARCDIGTWAIVSIEAYREDLKDVQCVSLNDGMFKDPVLILGDIDVGSRDICAFEANEKIDAPPRFEITYNDGKTAKTMCERGWQLD